MFRGYASQHDAKRFGVRMTAKTFRTLVILLPLLRHFERSEKSSYFSFHNTRLHWMFRGYASQHDAKRFGVRMTAKTFRALVILLPLLRHFKRSEKSSYFSYHTLVTLSAAKNPVISRITTQDFTGCFEATPLNMTLNASASE
ncbi:hypothetical protein SAMN06298224_0241 [Fibrobacter sp. UWB16]|nr:hypothetical protein SAMN06298224_0241 [Fibrobacter sp. UWB16]